jgi:hypothetical protein
VRVRCASWLVVRSWQAEDEAYQKALAIAAAACAAAARTVTADTAKELRRLYFGNVPPGSSLVRVGVCVRWARVSW